jgi:hypothetical protein
VLADADGLLDLFRKNKHYSIIAKNTK